MPEHERHPGDQRGTLVESVEILAAHHPKDEAWITERDLDQIVQASKEVGFSPALTLSAGARVGLDPAAMPSFGTVANLRRVGKKLLADFVNVPAKLAALLRRGGYTRISTSIFHDYTNALGRWPRVLKNVCLHGDGLPRVDSLGDLEKLYRRQDGQGELHVYTGRLQPAEDVDDLIHAHRAEVRQERKQNVNDELTVRTEYNEASLAVERLVREYRLEHPEVNFETALRAVFSAFPAVKEAYARSRHGADRIVVFDGKTPQPDVRRAPLSPSIGGGAPQTGSDWDSVQAIVLERMHQAQLKNPYLDDSAALSFVLQQDPELRLRYERGPS